MLYGDDKLLDIIKDQTEQITHQANQIRDLSEELALLRAGEKAERCVICGAIIPEGRQVCPKCKEAIEHDGGLSPGGKRI